MLECKIYIYIFLRNQIEKIYNRAKELNCDATIFVCWFFIVYEPEKNGNWKIAQNCKLSQNTMSIESMLQNQKKLYISEIFI